MELIGARAAKKRDKNKLKYKYRGMNAHLVILKVFRIHVGGETNHLVFLGWRVVPNLSISNVERFLSATDDNRDKQKKLIITLNSFQLLLQTTKFPSYQVSASGNRLNFCHPLTSPFDAPKLPFYSVLPILIPVVYAPSPRYAQFWSVSSSNRMIYNDRIPILSASVVSTVMISMASRYLSFDVSKS